MIALPSIDSQSLCRLPRLVRQVSLDFGTLLDQDVRRAERRRGDDYATSKSQAFVCVDFDLYPAFPFLGRSLALRRHLDAKTVKDSPKGVLILIFATSPFFVYAMVMSSSNALEVVSLSSCMSILADRSSCHISFS